VLAVTETPTVGFSLEIAGGTVLTGTAGSTSALAGVLAAF
jgi:hypothetical protein